ncbi:DUF481 domain-containing protein [Pseudoalteromonas lipolytica]|jgi:putative salt-induced outer membrane protein YdiY|uniref:DUF481 domain-containing protein n=1 Tax=Pseudoalteromonas lipolytica TaxID=570156 RepID=A0AAD0RZQ3_9GAMM|nr:MULTISPECIES: DUF481 domain-containing protein [Pseudoalteromonas]AXV65494.1 DUF481 domain-containing protein [Pseudoalteromonas donghaensis]QMW13274.1 DUF481 domain-containing protein [Pseudoalteromonas sp. MT33b]
MLKKHLLISTLLLSPLTCFANESLPDPLLEERGVIIKDASQFDWVRLNSGEWLKGELIAMYDKELEFDSDVLDTLVIDREDIYMIVSDRHHTVRFNDGTELSGTLNISGGYVKVGDLPAKYRYRDLVSIAPSIDSELSAWTVKISLGADLSRGNTDQTEYSARADIKRRTASSRFLAEFLGYRTTSDEQVTKNNIRANGTFDWFYTQKMYFRPIFFEYYRDPFQNIANKYTVGAGVGYYVMDTDKTEWDFSTGPAYQKTEFDTVTTGEDKSNASMSYFIGTNFEHELTKKIDFTFNYRYLTAKSDTGGDSQYAMASFEIDITDDIDFDISLVWDYLADPIADENAVVPEKEDYKMIFALGIDL